MKTHSPQYNSQIEIKWKKQIEKAEMESVLYNPHILSTLNELVKPGRLGKTAMKSKTAKTAKNVELDEQKPGNHEKPARPVMMSVKRV